MRKVSFSDFLDVFRSTPLEHRRSQSLKVSVVFTAQDSSLGRARTFLDFKRPQPLSVSTGTNECRGLESATS